MAVFKCKECGGNLNVTEGQKICTCEFCESVQTVPNSDNEKKVNLFNRADRLRFNGDYDKAANIYESIVAEFPEETEAYWGLCLCKYGIEYVDDPSTGRKMPTCHRTSYESIFNDLNFSNVMKLADGETLSLYQSRAQEIDRIQKGILDIVKNELPYDIFICYKESTEDKQRTEDSIIAQDIYDDLTKEGYKVFFSRITLEDKLGVEYEPYIFAALNSAKIMLAFGTKYEYFDAIWVKNEWSRFLSLMRNDKTKMLIPCYRDIDPSEMPQEFRGVQGQDMSRLGFKQDLIRGIGKIIPKGAKGGNDNHAVNASKEMVTTVDSLLERVFDIYLPNNKWKEAYDACEKVLNADPKNSRAYFGKLMTELEISNENDLGVYKKNFENIENFQYAYKFASQEEKRKYQTFLYKNFEYLGAQLFNNQQFEEAKKYFKRIEDAEGYPNAEAMIRKCDEEIKHREEGIKRFRDIYRKFDISLPVEHAYEVQQYIDETNYMRGKYKKFFPEKRYHPIWSIWFFGAGIGMLITLIVLIYGSVIKIPAEQAANICVIILTVSLIIAGIAAIIINGTDGRAVFIISFIVLIVVDTVYAMLLLSFLPISFTYGMMYSIISAPIFLFLSILSMGMTKKYNTKLKNLNNMQHACEQALESDLKAEYSAIQEKYPSINKVWMIAMQNQAKKTYKNL